MERKTLRILNAAKAGLYNIFNIEHKITEYFGKQGVLFVPEETDFFRGYNTFDFGWKYGNTTAKFINKQGTSGWKVKLESENGGVSRTKSALVKKLGLKFASCR